MPTQHSHSDFTPDPAHRQRAEEILQGRDTDFSNIPIEEARTLLRDFAVRHIELELQNAELRKAQVELIQMRDEFTELYNLAPVGCLTLDSQGTILAANLTAAKMLGVERQLLLQVDIREYIAHSYHNQYAVHQQSVFSSSETHSCKLRVIPQLGEALFARIDSVAFGPTTDRRCHTTLTDITHERATAESLRQLNDTLEQRVAEQTSDIHLLAAAVSHLGEGILITEASLEWPGPQIIFVNDALCRITGYTTEELIGQTPRILHGSETDRELLSHIKRELSADHSCRAELLNYRKDGSQYFANIDITPLFDADGHRTHFVSIHRDVTEQKRTQKALIDREERLRSLVNTAADAIVTIDTHGIITDVNPSTSTMFGYTEEELVGNNIAMLMPPPHCNEHDEYIQRYLRSRTPHVIGIGRDAFALRKDGSLFPVSLAISEVGHLSLFTGIIRDMTEHTQLQREILQAADDEQRRIGQDLHDSTQQELAGLGMLTQALIDNLACDAGPSAAAPREKHCDIARRILGGIDRVHRDLQSLSRGLIPGTLEQLGLAGALRELAYRTDALEKLSCAFKCEQPIKLKDNTTATHLYRIAQEALTNALKHAQPEHILIALSFEDGCVVLQVADDGIGISEARSQKGMGIKNMFYRASLIGAELIVDPVESGGTLVTCKLIGEDGH